MSSPELPAKFTAANVYRTLTAISMIALVGLGGKIWNGQDDKFGDVKSSLGKIVDAVEKSANILTDVRLDVQSIKGEQSRLRQVDESFADRMNRLEKAYERQVRTRGIDGQ